MQLIIGYLMGADIFPNHFFGPTVKRVDLNKVVTLIPFHQVGIEPVQGLVLTDAEIGRQWGVTRKAIG